jgi:phosphatidyl-N-methylethanolamine N-methyltransferase
MKFVVFVVAAIALSFERICYAWIWRQPGSFRRICSHPLISPWGEPVAVLEKLFYGFKLIQIAVFLGWCYFYGDGSLQIVREGPVLAAGTTLIVVGQILNLSVFWRLSAVGVFYGNRLGYEIPWSTEFPFSLLRHPQYVGSLLSIWGFFLAMRFPHYDWYVLPCLETAYYTLGAYFEQ